MRVCLGIFFCGLLGLFPIEGVSGTSAADEYAVLGRIKSIHAVRMSNGQWQPFNTGVQVGVVSKKGPRSEDLSSLDIVVDATKANLKSPACAKRFSTSWIQYQRTFVQPRSPNLPREPPAEKLWAERAGQAPEIGHSVRLSAAGCDVRLVLGYRSEKWLKDYPGLSKEFLGKNFKTSMVGQTFAAKNGRIEFLVQGSMQSFDFVVEQVGF